MKGKYPNRLANIGIAFVVLLTSPNNPHQSFHNFVVLSMLPCWDESLIILDLLTLSYVNGMQNFAINVT